MCLQYRYQQLKTKNAHGVNYAYVPCGVCAQCRKAKQDEWRFRLNAEFLKLKQKGWNVAFCTLTYREETLPHIPKALFQDKSQYRAIPCFSKVDVQTWIRSIRQYFKYHNKFTHGENIRYFVASEYGSKTHRPHYHALLAWPRRVSYEKMHAVATYYWDKGYLFPRDPRGEEKVLPFEVVGDMSKALTYCSKYACKDIDFLDTISGLNLNTKMKLYGSIQHFHIQSKSLGYEFIADMSDREKREAFVHGVSFQGDGEVYKIPLYIKNRIVFDNYYVVRKNGERLVRREASAFFEKYKDEMFREKGKFYAKVFQEASTKEYFESRGVDSARAGLLASHIASARARLNHHIGFDVTDSPVLGEYYLCYYGVKKDECSTIETFDDAVGQWMRRYRHSDEVGPVPEVRRLDINVHSAIQALFSMQLGALTFCNMLERYKLLDEERLIKRINEYFNFIIGD